jgi:hypothetical protein
LPSSTTRAGMPEAKLPKVQRSDKSFDRSNRIVAIHIIFHARRKKARLIPANADLENAIRHTESYTRSPNPLGLEYLHSLAAQPGTSPSAGKLFPDCAAPGYGPPPAVNQTLTID